MGFILFVAAVAFLVWSLVFVFRGSLIGACAVYLMATCCMDGNLWALEAGGFTWTIDRLLFLFIAVTFCFQWRIGRTEVKRVSVADGVLLSCFALVVVSTFTHDWGPKPGDKTSTLMHLIDGYLIPLVIFFVAKHSRVTEREVRLTYGLLAALGFYLAVTALFEGTGQWSLVFPRFIADPELGIHFGRARGPMLQSARLGLVLIVCAAATIGLVLQAGAWKRPAMLLSLLLVPLYGVAVYFTYTRSVWIGAAMASFVGLWLGLRRRGRIALFATAAAGLALVVVAKGERLIAFERESSASVTRESTYMRASFAYVSWQMFLDRPLTGVGFGQYKEQSQPYLSDRTTWLQLEQIRGYIHHNTLLSLLVELGVCGPVLFVACLLCWFASAVAVWRDRTLPTWMRRLAVLFLIVLAPYSLQLLFREVTYSPIESSVLFFFAGMVCAVRSTQLAARKQLQLSPLVSHARRPSLSAGGSGPSFSPGTYSS